MIPYYEKDEGIRTYPKEEGGRPYVILDKIKVDRMDPNIWNTFEAVRQECETELVQQLDILEAFLALSPDGEGTYVINFSEVSSNGGLLL